MVWRCIKSCRGPFQSIIIWYINGHAYIDASPSWRQAHVCSGIFTDKKCNKKTVYVLGIEDRVWETTVVFFWWELLSFVAVMRGYEVNTSVIQHMKIPPQGASFGLVKYWWMDDFRDSSIPSSFLSVAILSRYIREKNVFIAAQYWKVHYSTGWST